MIEAMAAPPKNVVDQILGQGSGSSVPVMRPIATPESGILAPGAPEQIITRPPGAFAGGVCLSRGELMRRIQYASFQGIPTTAVCFPYVLSDKPSATKYRIVIMADLQAVVSAATIQASLFLLPPGPLPSKVDGTDPFFLNYSAISPIRNYGPPAQGIRIDGNSGIVNTNNQAPQPGQPLPLLFIGDFVVVPPGWTLMGYDLSGVATVPTAGAQLELRIAYAELDLSEDFSW